mmetsp:Transcript_46882/g.108401  ORF Transcript_46882/g.108401 Transcript_46882/m.108401 type:complete len:214 (+) Transcript_46882:674-1315(+)
MNVAKEDVLRRYVAMHVPGIVQGLQSPHEHAPYDAQCVPALLQGQRLLQPREHLREGRTKQLRDHVEVTIVFAGVNQACHSQACAPPMPLDVPDSVKLLEIHRPLDGNLCGAVHVLPEVAAHAMRPSADLTADQVVAKLGFAARYERGLWVAVGELCAEAAEGIASCFQKPEKITMSDHACLPVLGVGDKSPQDAIGHVCNVCALTTVARGCL